MGSIHRRALAPCGLLAAAIVLPEAVAAQYIRPGDGLDEPQVRTRVTVEAAALNSQWELGPLKVTPTVELRDIRYESDIRGGREGGEESDFTATFGAGLDFYLRAGEGGYFNAGVHPAYVGWLEHSERNRLLGRYTVGYVGDFNRLEVRLDAGRSEVLDYPSSELLVQVPQREDTGRLDLGFSFDAHWSLRLGISESRLSLEGDDSAFAPSEAVLRRLDRSTSTLRAGLRWKAGDSWWIEAGAQRIETDFDDPTRLRSHAGDSAYLESQYRGPHASLRLGLVQMRLEPVTGSEFQPIDELTGSARLSVTPGWRVTYLVYGLRQVTYSFSEELSHFLEDRVGVGVSVPFSEQLHGSAFYEVGTLEPKAIAGVRPGEGEDFTGYGTLLSWSHSQRLTLRLGGGVSEYDSPLAGGDRSITWVRAGISASFGVVRVDVDARQ